MTNKVKTKKVQKTIYLDMDIYERIERDRSIMTRSISEEIEHNLKTLFSIRDKNNDQAIELSTR